MLHDQKLPKFLWGEATNTTVYVQNVEGNVTRFGLHKCPFDICIYSRKEILFLLYMSMSFLLIEMGLAHVKVL